MARPALQAGIDRAFLRIAARLSPRHFTESVESRSLADHLGAVALRMPPLQGEGEYPVAISSLIGDLDAAVVVAQWRGPSVPTLVYHHGGSEVPCTRTLRALVQYHRTDVPANLVCVRAPFHATRKEFIRSLARLENWVAMVASGVALVEAVLQDQSIAATAGSVVSGYSLGGFVTNLHHVHHDSADYYAPLAAGLLMGDCFLDGVLRGRATDDEAAAVRDTLNFEGDLRDTVGTKVFPVLCRYDQINLYERHLPSYGNGPAVTVWERGHLVGFTKRSSGLARAHLLPLLERAAQNPSSPGDVSERSAESTRERGV